LLPSADSALWKKRLYSALEKVCWVPTKQQQQQCDGRIVGGRAGRFVICLVRGRNGYQNFHYAAECALESEGGLL